LWLPNFIWILYFFIFIPMQIVQIILLFLRHSFILIKKTHTKNNHTTILGKWYWVIFIQHVCPFLFNVSRVIIRLNIFYCFCILFLFFSCVSFFFIFERIYYNVVYCILLLLTHVLL
jgi:hypothetical protein